MMKISKKCIKPFGLLKTLAIILFLALIQSCSNAVHVSVDSICASNAKEKTKYILLPGNENCSESDLQFQEFALYTDIVLTERGFEKSTNIEKAEIAIVLTYGISEPNIYQYSYTVPIFGQTGVNSSYTSGCLNTIGNLTNYSSTTTYEPIYGIVGSNTQTGIAVSYSRYMALFGVDLENYNNTNKVTELWSTKAISTGSKGDLRAIFPYMLTASKKYIATNSRQKIDIELHEKDKEVKKIKELVK